MNIKEVLELARPNILKLTPYRCARDDYSTGILLDANENNFGNAAHGQEELHLEKYPDPHQKELKSLFKNFRNLDSSDRLFFGVGSDEGIDLVIRVFCTPGKDKILICNPTYGMYSVCAQVNDVEVVKVPLKVDDGSFQLEVDKIKQAIDVEKNLKVCFFCNPGNPTGTLLRRSDIIEILQYFKGIVVVDEAYIDFSYDENHPLETQSFTNAISKYPNLIVLQTLSKSFGLAGIRFGVSVSAKEVAQLFNNTKAPYNISTLTHLTAKTALEEAGIKLMRSNLNKILMERERLTEKLKSIKRIGKIKGTNDANFILFEVLDKAGGKPCNSSAVFVYKKLADDYKVVVRYRGTELGCEGCLRVTVGTPSENLEFLNKLMLVVSS
ncbi:histidinol-phosphate transaminase [Clydaea vesicula]|uniref:histidinol-phosphate transaminase n=1 Tax=Clydaea vesicula TaxID=447962 RepID=A0AAD5XWT2_9FUNG|nr:histidinol-phosphate transaminase [Clydaea vesicula]KAJ3387872.1 histidinol-phosphate transaminase [Lobulomyces angularis]